MRRLITLRICLLAIAAIAAASATSAAAKPPGTNGKILINRADNSATGEEQTFTVDPDGTDFTLLANNSEAGQWSWDGTRIAMFEGVLDFDSGVLTSLNLDTQYPDMFLGCALWSPDDARLACEGFGLTDPSLNGIYTVRSSDGGDLQRVTSNPGGDDCPSDYSPYGNRIVFTRVNDTTYELDTVRPDGSGLRRISPAGLNFNFCNGSWSPQGNEILLSAAAAYARSRRPTAAASTPTQPASAASIRAGRRTARRSFSAVRSIVSRGTSTPSTPMGAASSASRTRPTLRSSAPSGGRTH